MSVRLSVCTWDLCDFCICINFQCGVHRCDVFIVSDMSRKVGPGVLCNLIQQERRNYLSNYGRIFVGFCFLLELIFTQKIQPVISLIATAIAYPPHPPSPKSTTGLDVVTTMK